MAALGLVGVALGLGCGVGDDVCDSEPGPEDASWTAVTSKCGFAFYAPPDVVEVAVQGTDSCVARYDAGGCTYTADYGLYSSDLGDLVDQPHYQRVDVHIAARAAMLVTVGPVQEPKPYIAASHFPDVPAGHGMALTIIARCDSVEAQQTALDVYRSLTFAPRAPACQ